jgi:hypothetical protein
LAESVTSLGRKLKKMSPEVRDTPEFRAALREFNDNLEALIPVMNAYLRELRAGRI